MTKIETSTVNETRQKFATASGHLREALSGSRIGGLDFLRAVSVLLVLLSHSGISQFGPMVLFDGGLGVEAFFVISGFLITWLLLNEVALNGRISLLSFYRRRAARLLPAFYAYLTVGLAILLLRNRPVPWDAVWASALYLINYQQATNGAPTHYLSHCWSLAVEEQFYLLWPLLLIWLLGRRVHLARALVIAVALMWMLKAIYVFALGVSDEYLYRSLETRGDQLAIGCLLAVLLKSEGWRQRFEMISQFRWKSIALLVVALVISTSTLRGSPQLKYLAGYAVEPLLIATLLPLVVLEAGRQGLLTRLLNAKSVVLLGQISYGVYLFHPFVMHPVRNAVGAASGMDGLGVLASIGATVAVAYVSFRWFEQPLRQRLTQPSSPRPERCRV